MAPPADRDKDRDKIVERVRALLAKANGTDHEPERDAFLAKAQALITRHHIAEGELNESSWSVGHETIHVERWGNATRGVVMLYGEVAELNRCSTGHRVTRGQARVELFGTDLDRELTRTLVDHLLPQLKADLLRDRPQSRMSYSMGWVSEVKRRLAAVRQAEAAQARALIPTNIAADEALHAAFRISRGRSTTVDPRAYGSGLEAGENVDIGHTKIKA